MPWASGIHSLECRRKACLTGLGQPGPLSCLFFIIISKSGSSLINKYLLNISCGKLCGVVPTRRDFTADFSSVLLPDSKINIEQVFLLLVELIKSTQIE